MVVTSEVLNHETLFANYHILTDHIFTYLYLLTCLVPWFLNAHFLIILYHIMLYYNVLITRNNILLISHRHHYCM